MNENIFTSDLKGETKKQSRNNKYHASCCCKGFSMPFRCSSIESLRKNINKGAKKLISQYHYS